MSRMLRVVVADARAALASTLRACAAEGLLEQESGKRFAAPGGGEIGCEGVGSTWLLAVHG
jgi:hypothetical protein